MQTTGLHVGIIRPVAALWRRPSDVLTWIFDIAGLTVNAVLKVDDKLRHAILFDNLIYTRWAVPLSRLSVGRKVDVDWYRRIAKPKVAWLAFLVIGRGKAHVGEAIKAQDAVGLWILNLVKILGLARCLCIIFTVFKRSKKRKPKQFIGPHKDQYAPTSTTTDILA